MILIIFSICIVFVISQQCGDADVVCYGVGKDGTTLQEVLDLVTPGSGINYVLLSEDVYGSNEGGNYCEINSTHAAGTEENPIKIMADPDAGVPITIHFDTYDTVPWILRIARPYWVLDGGANKDLIVSIEASYGWATTGLILIDTDSGGKVAIQNMRFECRYSEETVGIGIYCTAPNDCNDEAFDKVLIDNVDFVSFDSYNGWMGVKIVIDAFSWTTKKVTISNCNFGLHEGTGTAYDGCMWYGVFAPAYTADQYGGNEDYEYHEGCQNCEIVDCIFYNVYEPLRFDVGQDIDVHDCEFYPADSTMGGLQYGIVNVAHYDESAGEDQRLTNFHFYDNVVDFTTYQVGYSIVYFYSDEIYYYDPWVVNMVFSDNELLNLPYDLIYNENHRGKEIIFDSNVITTQTDNGNNHLIYWYDSESDNGQVSSITLVNNDIRWDRSSVDYNTSFVDGYGGHVSYTIAYNYFELTDDTEDIAVFMFEGETYVDNIPFGDIEVYGNVIYHERDVVEFGVDSAGLEYDFMLQCDSLSVTYNIFSNKFLFPIGATEENNVISEDESLYDISDACTTPFIVPFDSLLTPPLDLDGGVRVTSGDSYGGPYTCIECVAFEQCSGTTPFCNTETWECEGCDADDDKCEDPLFPVCDVDSCIAEDDEDDDTDEDEDTDDDSDDDVVYDAASTLSMFSFLF